MTVGSFDGVHAGHRAILRTLADTARKKGGESVVVTFAPHPRQVLHPDDRSLRLLNSLEEKIYLLEQAGVDNLLVVRFTPEFSRLDSETFVRRYLLEGIGAKSIVLGYNHQFGHDREGDRDFLEKLKEAHDFEVIQVPKQEVSEQKVSSTVLRFLIGAGELAQAREILTEPYFFIGKKGECGLLEYGEPAKLFPPPGTYPVSVEDGGSVFDTRLLIHDGKLGLPLPAQSHCQPEERLIVRFKNEPKL